MLRRCLTIVFAVVLACGWVGAAWGEPGGKADPTDDVFNQDTQRTGPGHLDIVKVSHTDDGQRLTYTVRTAHQWVRTDLDTVSLNIKRLPGLPQYDCQQVAAFVAQKAGALQGSVDQCLGSGGGQEGGPGGSKRLGPVTATHEENTDTITLAFDLSVLRGAGFTGSSFEYNVVLKEKVDTENWDIVPNDVGYEHRWITHTFSAPATPEPTATPTVAPTPSPARTVAPTPEPTTEPTPSPTPDADAASFAAPQERTSEDGTSTPLRVAAVGSVVAGAGIALVRFWPS